MRPAPAAARTVRKTRPEWEELGYKNSSELLMHQWLIRHVCRTTLYESDRIVLTVRSDDSPKVWTVPDFVCFHEGQRVFIELTMCRWNSHRSGRKRREHRDVLKRKRARRKRLHKAGYAYVLVEGDWYRDIMRADAWAIARLHGAIVSEADRARRHAAVVPTRAQAAQRQRNRQRSRRRDGHYQAAPVAA